LIQKELIRQQFGSKPLKRFNIPNIHYQSEDKGFSRNENIRQGISDKMSIFQISKQNYGGIYNPS